MANVRTLTINFSGGTPSWAAGSVGATTLEDGDTMTVQLSGFPSNSQGQVTAVSFFHNQVVGGNDQKNTNAPAGYWTSAAGDVGLTVYSVSGRPTAGPPYTGVLIEDLEAPSTDDKYWFSIGGSYLNQQGGSVPFGLDPQIINKKKV